MAIENNHLRTVFDQDGAAILDIKHDLIVTLNATGAYVWQRLQRGETLETIVTNLVCETGEETVLVEGMCASLSNPSSAPVSCLTDVGGPG